MKEITCQFGEHQRLSGILTQTPASSSSKTLVLINAGLDGRHGPYRLYTHIARRAVHQGIPTFRFDLGDIGYSQPGNPGSPLTTRTMNEIRITLDYLQTTFGMKKFVLGGFVLEQRIRFDMLKGYPGNGSCHDRPICLPHTRICHA